MMGNMWIFGKNVLYYWQNLPVTSFMKTQHHVHSIELYSLNDRLPQKAIAFCRWRVWPLTYRINFLALAKDNCRIWCGLSDTFRTFTTAKSPNVKHFCHVAIKSVTVTQLLSHSNRLDLLWLCAKSTPIHKTMDGNRSCHRIYGPQWTSQKCSECGPAPSAYPGYDWKKNMDLKSLHMPDTMHCVGFYMLVWL